MKKKYTAYIGVEFKLKMDREEDRRYLVLAGFGRCECRAGVGFYKLVGR